MAFSVREAFELFLQCKPNIVISDIAIPAEDGYSLIRKIRALPTAKGGKIPAIALTAYAGPENRKEALSHGFQEHLSKPVDILHLVRTIEDTVNHYKTACENNIF
jgi:CheY-like chemotaxis protein